MSEETLQNYINGKWVESSTGKFREVPNPATAEILAKVPVSSAAELDEAVQAAHKAFQDWRRVPVTKRIQYLFKLKDLLEANFEDLARCITEEHGKVMDESRGEMRRCDRKCRGGLWNTHPDDGRRGGRYCPRHR